MATRLFSKRLLRKEQRGQRTRPRTYKTEEAAKASAERNKIAKFTVAQKGKKFIIQQ